MIERLEKIQSLLGIEGSDQDRVLTIVIQTVEKMVLSYLARDVLPTALEDVLILMCVSYYKSAGFGDASAAIGSVTSVKRGDVTTSFANISGSSQAFDLGADSGDFFGWKTVLNEYRKLRW